MSRNRRSHTDPTPRKALGLDWMEMMSALVGVLSEREAGVISMHFGLYDGRPTSLGEIGSVYGITAERVRQIESVAISKMRRNPEILDLIWNRQVDVINVRVSASNIGLVWCPQCHTVPVIHSELSKGGRRRKYCSARCRQAAYRARKMSRTILMSPSELSIRLYAVVAKEQTPADRVRPRYPASASRSAPVKTGRIAVTVFRR